jgi:uncharacterized protein (TIGR03435 family)
MAIVAAVLNSLWQAALLAAFVWLALRRISSLNAATRFAIWWATLGAVLFLPAAPGMIESARSALTPRAARPLLQVHAAPPVPIQGTALPPIVIVEGRKLAQWRLWVAALWALILVYRSVQLVGSFVYLWRVKKGAFPSSQSHAPIPLPIPMRRSARLLLSPEIQSPIAVGFFEPAVILPESLRGMLSEHELDHVIRHETAHLERWDDWTNLLARILDAILALHPVALWILRQIEIEREAACDDWVVSGTDSPKHYARSLLHLYEIKSSDRPRGELLAAGMFGNASRLGARIEALLHRGRNFSPRTSFERVTLSASALVLVCGLAALCPRWVAFAQKSDGPQFEVASVRPSDPNQGFINAVTPSLKVGGDRNLTFVHISLRDLIMLAYGVGAPQVKGPRFLNGTSDSPADRFDIVARVPAGATPEQVPLMLQALLAERFHLEAHRESQTIQAYVLEVGKNPPKMKASPEGANGAARCVRSFAEHEGATLAAECTRMTSADIAQQAMALAPGYFRDGPVVDQTGLQGTYDFKIEWITAAESRDGRDGPTMIEAIQNQLGLKVERRRQAVETLVIDKLDRKPTEN